MHWVHNPHKSGADVIIIPILQMEKLGIGKLSNLPKDIQLVNSEAWNKS